MAYMTKDGNGPYPNKAGEYCGNHFPNSPPHLTLHQSPEEAEQHLREWLKKMRFGRPRPCQAGTSKEMAEEGWVGLYLIKGYSEPLRDGDIEVPTPPELMEPLV